jgi:hypothetical protein
VGCDGFDWWSKGSDKRFQWLVARRRGLGGGGCRSQGWVKKCDEQPPAGPDGR